MGGKIVGEAVEIVCEANEGGVPPVGRAGLVVGKGRRWEFIVGRGLRVKGFRKRYECGTGVL